MASLDDVSKEPIMKNVFARFAQDESGATAIEYGLIAALISVALIAAATLLGTNLGNLFNGIAGKLSAATPAA
jgi:pilus assembly protein Flp/PilA